MEVFFYGVNEDAKVYAHKFVFLKIYHKQGKTFFAVFLFFLYIC